MTRSNKKRNRSNTDSGSKEAKKSKSMTKDASGNKTQDPLKNNNIPTIERNGTHSSMVASTPVSTPKEKLNFSEGSQEDVLVNRSVDTMYPDAPDWAKALMSKLEKVEELATNTQQAVAGIVDSNAEITGNCNKLCERVEKLEIENLTIKNENIELREKLLLLEFHQRRNNLVFDGIAESTQPEDGRDCYNKIIECLSYIPGLEVNCVRIDRCHRLGAKQKFKPRSIIAKFNWYGDLTQVLKNRSYLPKGVYVSEDYPEEWLDRRQLLRPILMQARKSAKYKDSCFLSRDKLLIDGKQFTIAPVNNLTELPAELTPSTTCERKDNNTIAFLGPHSVYSNFHHAPFVQGNVRYTCAEQMIQAEKAALFKDKITLQKIMKSKSPYCMKELGGRVRNYDKETWYSKSKDIVTRAVQAKFEQNPLLGKLLKSTGTTDIVEASKDKFWGTGIDLRDPNVLNRDQWNSKGQMCEILKNVRKVLV